MQCRIVYRVGKILTAEIHEGLQLVQVGCFLFFACILRLNLCIPCLARLLYSCCQSFVFILRRLELLLQLRNRLLIATVGALLGMLLFPFLMRLLCSCTNSIWCCFPTVSAHCSRRTTSIRPTSSTSPVWSFWSESVNIRHDQWFCIPSIKVRAVMSCSRKSFFALARLARSLRCQAGDDCLFEALCSGVLQNEISPLKKQRKDQKTNSLA